MRPEYDFSRGWRETPFNDGKSIKATYPGPLNPEIDAAIRRKIKACGGKEYASGFDFTKGVRDICYDLPGEKG